MGIFGTSDKEKETQKKNTIELLQDLNKSEMIEEDTMSNLSDREIQVAILKTNRKTNLWITFIGWVVLIGIAFNIIMALGLLSL